MPAAATYVLPLPDAPHPLRGVVAHIDEGGNLIALSPASSMPPAALDPPGSAASNAAAARLHQQLLEYIAGRRTRFDVPLAPRGTDFQQRVWSELLAIPWGHTRTYGELAAALGRPGGARAVGQANGSNPIAIVIPCHRVVASDGLGGYTGGLPIKRALLQIEGVLEAPSLLDWTPA